MRQERSDDSVLDNTIKKPIESIKQVKEELFLLKRPNGDLIGRPSDEKSGPWENLFAKRSCLIKKNRKDFMAIVSFVLELVSTHSEREGSIYIGSSIGDYKPIRVHVSGLLDDSISSGTPSLHRNKLSSSLNRSYNRQSEDSDEEVDDDSQLLTESMRSANWRDFSTSILMSGSLVDIKNELVKYRKNVLENSAYTSNSSSYPRLEAHSDISVVSRESVGVNDNFGDDFILYRIHGLYRTFKRINRYTDEQLSSSINRPNKKSDVNSALRKYGKYLGNVRPSFGDKKKKQNKNSTDLELSSSSAKFAMESQTHYYQIHLTTKGIIIMQEDSLSDSLRKHENSETLSIDRFFLNHVRAVDGRQLGIVIGVWNNFEYLSPKQQLLLDSLSFHNNDIRDFIFYVSDIHTLNHSLEILTDYLDNTEKIKASEDQTGKIGSKFLSPTSQAYLKDLIEGGQLDVLLAHKKIRKVVEEIRRAEYTLAEVDDSNKRKKFHLTPSQKRFVFESRSYFNKIREKILSLVLHQLKPLRFDNNSSDSRESASFVSNLKLDEVRKNIRYLLELGYIGLAREAFFNQVSISNKLKFAERHTLTITSDKLRSSALSLREKVMKLCDYFVAWIKKSVELYWDLFGAIVEGKNENELNGAPVTLPPENVTQSRFASEFLDWCLSELDHFTNHFKNLVFDYQSTKNDEESPMYALMIALMSLEKLNHMGIGIRWKFVSNLTKVIDSWLEVYFGTVRMEAVGKGLSSEDWKQMVDFSGFTGGVWFSQEDQFQSVQPSTEVETDKHNYASRDLPGCRISKSCLVFTEKMLQLVFKDLRLFLLHPKYHANEYPWLFDSTQSQKDRKILKRNIQLSARELFGAWSGGGSSGLDIVVCNWVAGLSNYYSKQLFEAFNRLASELEKPDLPSRPSDRRQSSFTDKSWEIIEQMLMVLGDFDWLSESLMPFIKDVIEAPGCKFKSNWDSGLEKIEAINVEAAGGRISSYQAPPALILRVGLGREIRLLNKLQSNLESHCDMLRANLMLVLARLIFRKAYPFGKACISADYSARTDNDNKAYLAMALVDYSDSSYPLNPAIKPSPAIFELSDMISKFRKFLTRIISDKSDSSNEITEGFFVDPVKTSRVLVEVMFRLMLPTDDTNWSGRKIGYTGIHQFLLDMHQLSHLLNSGPENEWLIPENSPANQLMTQICSRAMKCYFDGINGRQDNEQGKEQQHVLMPADWYNARIVVKSSENHDQGKSST